VRSESFTRHNVTDSIYCLSKRHAAAGQGAGATRRRSPLPCATAELATHRAAPALLDGARSRRNTLESLSFDLDAP
jgi:hypothetical protein